MEVTDNTETLRNAIERIKELEAEIEERRKDLNNLEHTLRNQVVEECWNIAEEVIDDVDGLHAYHIALEQLKEKV